MTAEIAILGGGCAGLSLAVELVRANVVDERRRLVVVEPRLAYERDRTWCFWDPVAGPSVAGPWEADLDRFWNRWAIRAGGREVVADGNGVFRYGRLRADRFYNRAVAVLEASPFVDLRLGAHVTNVEDAPGAAVKMRGRDGEGPLNLEASTVFDSRPTPVEAAERPGDVTLWQQFAGVEVEFDRPIDDPELATLMDFDAPRRALAGRAAIGFGYRLPLSTTSSLVEATAFAAERLDNNVISRLLDEQLAALERQVGPCRVVFRERGALPMSSVTLATAPSPRVRRIGLAGGFAKPSTGYAFVQTQRFCRDIARQMAAGRAVPNVPVLPWRTTFLDRVFLCRLRRMIVADPDSVGRLFARMFAGVDASAMVRFLSGVGSPRDDLRVILSMPKLPFVAEAARSWRVWTRPRRRRG